MRKLTAAKIEVIGNDHDHRVGGLGEYTDESRPRRSRSRTRRGRGPAGRWRPVRLAGELGANERADELGDDRHRHHDPGPGDRIVLAEQTEVDPQTSGGEEHRGEERVGDRFEMVEHLSLLEPRPMQHDTGDKGTEHRLVQAWVATP